MGDNFSQFKRVDGVRLRKIEEKLYIFYNEGYYEINEIGALVLQHISRDVKIGDFCDKVITKYQGVEKKQVEQDVLSFLEFLKNDKLIEEQ